MNFLERVSAFLNRLMVVIAGVFMVAMVLLTCSDIFFRLVWVPIRGSVELVGYFTAVVTAFALGYTQMRKGHTSVDVVVDLFPAKLKRFLCMLNSLICTAFFAVVSWRIAVWSQTIRQVGEVSETLRIAFYPFSYGVALGCAVLSLVFLTEFLKSFMPFEEDEP
ncbi:MAG: TRAP transporter small permease [Deltaproteobacteria bacterium]|nr:TRAP transporter small permease [Deltaproteobacteria bacterium]